MASRAVLHTFNLVNLFTQKTIISKKSDPQQYHFFSHVIYKQQKKQWPQYSALEDTRSHILDLKFIITIIHTQCWAAVKLIYPAGRRAKVSYSKDRNIYKILIVKVHVPTTAHKDEEVEDFYKTPSSNMQISKWQYKIVMDNINAKVEKQEQNESKAIAKFGIS